MFPLDSTKVELAAQRCALRMPNVFVCLWRTELCPLSARLRLTSTHPKIDLLLRPPAQRIPYIPCCGGLR
jgi:hypothetical protein